MTATGNCTQLTRTAPRRLIINADDFGRTSEVNEAVIRGYQDGVLTSASLMVTGRAFEEAVDLAQQNPGLAVGLHLVLVEGRSVLPASTIPHLVSQEGLFPNSCLRMGLKCFFSTACRRELDLELRAQFERFAATGLRFSHVDGHLHFHIHPSVFPRVVRLASEFDAVGIRIPKDRLSFRMLWDVRRAATRIGWAAVFCLSRPLCRHWVGQAALRSAEPTMGLMDTGQMDEERVIEMLDHVQSPLTELYLHPTVGRRIDRFGPNPDELNALLSPAVRRGVEARGLELCSYPRLRDRAEGEFPSEGRGPR
jgi:hopanoid biosynthesis associated protein HpnK